MCTLCGNPSLVHDQGTITSGLVSQTEVSTMGGMTLSVSSSLTASTIPTDSEPEIAFISAVTSSATVAATSYGAWYAAGAHHDPTYDPTSSYATKWGSTTLSTSGTPGGDVTYWFLERLGASRMGLGTGVVVSGSEHHLHARGGRGRGQLHHLPPAA